MAGFLTSITKCIEEDKIDIALKKLQAEWLKKAPKGWSAYNVIVSLNKVVLTALKTKKTCLSNVEDIYKLAELCCNVESMWEQDRAACMQCVYHVMRYMLSQSKLLLAKNLCKYFFELKKKKTFVKWEEKEILVLSNTVIYFVYYINDISKDINKISYSCDIEVLTSFCFTLEIAELNDFASTCHLFQVVFFLSRRAQNLLNHDDYVKFSMAALNYFMNHLKKIVDLNIEWSPKDENIRYSMNLLSDIIFLFKINDFFEQAVKTLLDFLNCLKAITTKAPVMVTNGQKAIDFELLKKTLQMCLYSTESSFASYFEDFCKLLSSKTNNDCFPFIHACLSTFRTKISSLLHKDDDKMKQLFPGLLKIYIQSKSKMTEEKSKRSELLHAFTNAMYFLNSSKVTSTTLSGIFKYVVMFFKEFDSLIVGNKTTFEFGVNYCINAIQTFKELELHKETATLSKSLLKCILMLDSSFLPQETFEVKLGHLLNFFIHSFSALGLITEAQIALIAFLGVHPKFVTVIFKFWAELKVNCPDHHSKDSTCYDLIISEQSVIEEKWPPCKVKNINIELCLLEELRAYAKYRELQVGPVVAVYRVASKIVKDKPLLASIVTATVDAVSSDEYIPTLKNLHISLENLLTYDLKIESEELDERKLCCLRLAIGDILYQLIRCDIVELRKKAEEELNFLNVPQKEEIPVIEGGASTVTPAYSNLKIAEQTQLFEKMSKAIYYWESAENIVTLEDSSFIHFRFMKGMAYICRLYSYRIKEKQAWETIYKLAKKVSNHKYQVLAVAELLILQANVNSTWLKEVEELVKNETSISKKSYIYSLWFINLGKNLVMNQKFDEAAKVIEELDESVLKRLFLVNAQYKLLLFSLKRDKLDLTPSRSEFTLYILVQIFESILFLIKHSRWKTFCEKCILQWLLLEYSVIIGKMYYDLRLVRHARCYAKKQLAVAQRLALPVRVCEFLTLLGAVDLLTGNRTDANEKLLGLDSILELDTVKVKEESDKFEVGYYFSQTSSEKDIRDPIFISHSLGCSCLVCDNVDFLLLTIEAFMLKGVFALSAGAQDLANHIFTIGKSLMEFTNEKIEKYFSDIPNRYNETKVRFYLNLTLAHANWGETDKASTYSKMVLESMDTCSRILQEEISYHSTALDWLCYEKPSSVVYKPKLYKEINDNSVQIVKTPEHAKPLSSAMPKGLKLFSSSKKFKIPVSPRPTMVKKCIFEDTEDSADEGQFIINKENGDGKTPEKKGNNLKKDKNTLAIPLSPSPQNLIKKTLCFDNSESNVTPKSLHFSLETPKEIKTYSTRARRVQTEKKATKKVPAAADLFSTPFPTKTVPGIKVFCDDDDDVSKTVKRRGRPPKSTTTVKKTVKKGKNVKVQEGRRKLFDSDTEEEVKTQRPERRLFVDSESEVENDKKNSFTSSDDSAIIEASFVENTGMKVCLPLTPLSTGLETPLKQLSINDKKDKMLSLSTRNKKKVKELQETPQSSLRKTLLRK
ncbi:unnamed protein product [Nezara viridula]|uniref:Separase n=1 Tax=Nezara viridula TaxID=85310 RepID=A0A9P0MNT9_NEZVI|nr:unnamed protein product [Nezara viridula]